MWMMWMGHWRVGVGLLPGGGGPSLQLKSKQKKGINRQKAKITEISPQVANQRRPKEIDETPLRHPVLTSHERKWMKKASCGLRVDPAFRSTRFIRSYIVIVIDPSIRGAACIVGRLGDAKKKK
jgi:hypothetical protein